MTLDFENVHLVVALRNGDRTAFETIYNCTAEKLLQYINSRIRNRAISEEMVQDIFISLWLRREKLPSDVLLEPYLFGAAKYRVLSHIRSEKVRQRYAEHLTLFAAQQVDYNAEDFMNLIDLKAVIDEYISQLPPKCQQVFRISRYEHKSIAEIAEEMGISTRTVENYITQALKHLRVKLAQYPWTLILILAYAIQQ